MDILSINKIKYLIVKVIKTINCSTMPPIITALEVDSSDIYIFDGQKYYQTSLFKNFTIGIILDDNLLLKKDTGLQLKKKNINNNFYWISQNFYLKKNINFQNIFIPKFNLFLINNNQLIPFFIPCKIINIDYNKEYIDLSIGEYYSLFN